MAFVKGQPFKPQFEDVDGHPAELGTLSFFLWDSTTPTPYYTDAIGTQGGTFVDLDLLGNPDGVDIFYDTAIEYKLVYKDRFGTVVYTAGPYIAPNSAANNSLAIDLANSEDASKGDALVAVKQPFTGSVARTQHDKNTDVISAKDFGASSSATAAQNTIAFQSAINVLNAGGGGALYIPAGTYLFGKGGAIDGRDYGLILQANVHLVGDGMGVTILKADASTDMDVITTPRSTPFVNVGLFDLTIDGDKDTNPAGGFNLWIQNGNGFYFNNFESNNSGSWACRVGSTINVIGNGYRVNTLATLDAAGDGFHIVDSSFITLSNMIINTPSDDGFIIEATTDDCHDISVTGLVVTTTPGNAGAGRGVLLFCDDTIASANRSIYNVTIDAATYDCKNQALVVQTAFFTNVNITLVDHGGGNTACAYIAAGSAVFRADIYNCEFNIKSIGSRSNGLLSLMFGSSTIRHNKLNLGILNPADGNVGASLRGEYWTGDISINYDPTGTKVSPSIALDFWASRSLMRVDVVGGSNCLNMRPGAIENTLHLNTLLSPTSVGLNINTSADRNHFIGGFVASLSNAGAANRFFGVRGLESYGSTSIAPNGSGLANIAHGLITTPTSVQTTIRGTSLNTANVAAVDGTNISVLIKNSTAVVTAGSFTVDWSAKY